MTLSRSPNPDNRFYFLSIPLILGAGIFAFWPIIEPRLQTSNPEASAPIVEQTDAEKALAAEAQGYRIILNKEPGNESAIKGLLNVSLQQQDLVGVEESLKSMAQLYSSYPEYQILLAQTQQQLGKYEEAAQSYRTVLELFPSNLNALQGMVNLLLVQSRPEGAIGLLQETIKTINIKPEAAEGADLIAIQLLLGKVYFEQNRITEAIAVYDQTIKLNKEDFRPYLAKSMLMQQQNQLEEAQRLLNQAATLSPAKYKDQIKAMQDSLSATDEELEAPAMEEEATPETINPEDLPVPTP
ncbi:MAG: tetratricopeptide repeat protein [Synechococcaceae cyanobacterium RL_1_2]|nr:tetratricopeptide repeat protein [Synechococcaceae cyanobacterium RL_1_2]